MTICDRAPAKRGTRVRVCSRTCMIAVVRWIKSRPRGDRAMPIEVLISAPWQRRRIEIRVRRAVRILKLTLPSPVPLDVAVIVQQAIMTEHQLPGCYQISQRPHGSRFALIRLALEVDGRHLTTDELLVPIDLVSPRSDDAQHPAVLRPDPLRPRRDVDEHGA